MAKKAPKKEYTNIITPIGVLSYPYLLKPDTGRTESSGKYSAEIYVPKAVWAKEGKPVVEAILKVAREYFKNPKIKLSEFKSPITDMDTVKDAKDFQKGCIRIRAKAGVEHRPVVIAPTKVDDKFPVWTDEQVATIKGGDHVRLIGSVYGYPQQGGGIAIGLNFVQFAKVGKAIGEGRMAQLKELEEIEVEVDSPDSMVDVEEDDSDDTDPMMQFG